MITITDLHTALLELLEKITKKSKLTEKEALKLGKEVNKRLAVRYSDG